MAVYTPIFVGAGDDAVPSPLSTGSLWRMDKESTFWKACSVGNWAAHFFKYAIVDVREVQQKLEDDIFDKMVSTTLPPLFLPIHTLSLTSYSSYQV